MLSAPRAFGAYMRALRERRGLSAPAVCRLVEGTSERIDKGSLWRLEHGEQGLSMGKLAMLGRVYGVPPDVLTERWELDRELGHAGGPATEELGTDELVSRGRRALTGQASKWKAYAYFRDAVARGDEARPAGLRLNLAVAIRWLGKNRLALHELFDLRETVQDTPLHPVVLDRISNCYRCLGDLDAATAFAEAALDEARPKDGRVAAFIHSSRANIDLARGETGKAVENLRRALRASRDPANANGALHPSPGFEVTVLNMLAECHLEAGDREAAKRAALAAGKVARRYDVGLGVAHSELALGRLDEQDGRAGLADVRWRRVGAIAERLGDRRLAFAAEFFAFRRALRAGETSRASAGRRRLERLAPWVPPHVPLVGEFWNLVGGDAGPGPRTRPARLRGWGERP